MFHLIDRRFSYIADTIVRKIDAEIRITVWLHVGQPFYVHMHPCGAKYTSEIEV